MQWIDEKINHKSILSDVWDWEIKIKWENPNDFQLSRNQIEFNERNGIETQKGNGDGSFF